MNNENTPASPRTNTFRPRALIARALALATDAKADGSLYRICVCAAVFFLVLGFTFGFADRGNMAAPNSYTASLSAQISYSDLTLDELVGLSDLIAEGQITSISSSRHDGDLSAYTLVRMSVNRTYLGDCGKVIEFRVDGGITKKGTFSRHEERFEVGERVMCFFRNYDYGPHIIESGKLTVSIKYARFDRDGIDFCSLGEIRALISDKLLVGESVQPE